MRKGLVRCENTAIYKPDGKTRKLPKWSQRGLSTQLILQTSVFQLSGYASTIIRNPVYNLESRVKVGAKKRGWTDGFCNPHQWKLRTPQVFPLSQRTSPLTLHFKPALHTEYSLLAWIKFFQISIQNQEGIKPAEKRQQLYKFLLCPEGGVAVRRLGLLLFGVGLFFFPVRLLLTQCWELRKHFACEYPPLAQRVGNQHSSCGTLERLHTAITIIGSNSSSF